MILGIDPGLANVGYAIMAGDIRGLMAHGHIETKRSKERGDTHRRLLDILRQLALRTASYNNDITHVVIEWPGGAGGANAQSVLQTIACAGFLAGYFVGRERIVITPAPQTWRIAMGGKKGQEEAVHARLLRDHPALSLLKKKAQPHVLDAVGLARYGLDLITKGT